VATSADILVLITLMVLTPDLYNLNLNSNLLFNKLS